VEGVGKEDSAAIAASVIGNDKKSLIKYLRRYTAPDNTYRMIIMDEQKNVLVDGRYNRQQDGQYVRMWITPFKDYSSVVLDQFSFDTKIENQLIWDYTSVYKENYPSVTSVKLYVHFSSLKGL